MAPWVEEPKEVISRGSSSMTSMAHSTARFRAGKDPEQFTATLSPGSRPSSQNISTTMAAMLGLVEVRLASRLPSVVVMRE